MAVTWTDDAERYGLVTRLIHWAMAALVAWQFVGMAVRIVVGRHPVTGFFVGSHVSIGTTLLALILLRAFWAVRQRRHRPSHGAGWLGVAATWGHRLLYALLLIVPTLAFVRALASGRDFGLFGIVLMRGDGQKIDWLMAPANALHGPLAWTLLALIVGHVLMVAVHEIAWRDGTLRRMAGRGVTPPGEPAPAG